MATSALLVTAIKCPAARLQNSDGTNFVQLMAAGALGSKIETISCTTDDTSNVILQFCVTVAAVDYILGEVTVPLGSGTNGTAKAVNILNATDLPWVRNDGINNYMYLENGETLKVKAKTAVTAGKFVYFHVQGGDIG